MERKIVVNSIPLDFGEDNEYHYDTQIWVYSSGSWWYEGHGKYCKTIEDVIQYAKEKSLLVDFI